MYNNVPVKARDIPGAKYVTIEFEKVYSICTENKCIVLINNLPVLTWSSKEWKEKTLKSKIYWYDNNPENKQNINYSLS